MTDEIAFMEGPRVWLRDELLKYTPATLRGRVGVLMGAVAVTILTGAFAGGNSEISQRSDQIRTDYGWRTHMVYDGDTTNGYLVEEGVTEWPENLAARRAVVRENEGITRADYIKAGEEIQLPDLNGDGWVGVAEDDIQTKCELLVEDEIGEISDILHVSDLSSHRSTKSLRSLFTVYQEQAQRASQSGAELTYGPEQTLGDALESEGFTWQIQEEGYGVQDYKALEAQAYVLQAGIVGDMTSRTKIAPGCDSLADNHVLQKNLMQKARQIHEDAASQGLEIPGYVDTLPIWTVKIIERNTAN